MKINEWVRIRVASLAVLSVCGLLGTVRASANDLLSGDLLIGAAAPAGFGAILLVRNGAISVFCESTPTSSAPNYFLNPTAVIADSQGRAVFLAEVGVSLSAPGTALMRCDGIGAAPEMLGYFPNSSSMAQGYPVPVIQGVMPVGTIFSSNPGEGEGTNAAGLHLVSLNTISATDLLAGVNNQDAYSLIVNVQGTGTASIRYRATDQLWEVDSSVLSSTYITSLDAIEHSGATYSTNGSNIQKAVDPLTLEASGTISGTSFSATLVLFGSANSFPPNTFEYNIADQEIPAGCMPDPPISNSMPVNAGPGSDLIPFNGSSLQSIFYDEFTGYGLIATTNYGPAQGPWLTNISEALLDNPGDPSQYFQDGFLAESTPLGLVCPVIYPFVPVTVPLPGTGPAPNYTDNDPSNKPASTVNGPMATQFTSTNPGGTDVIQLVTGGSAPVVVSGAQIAAAGFTDVQAIGAYPNGVSAGLSTTIVLRVDSPVNILITDPNGNQLGVDAQGNAHNTFTGTIVNPTTGGSENVNNGFDSGPGEPRFFAIQNPVPGMYTVQSIGTGSGPYTVHVYSVNTANPTGQAISTSGIASVGSVGSESFTLSASGAVAFVVPPVTLQSITVTPGTPSVAAGLTQQFTATGNYSNGSTQNLTSQATWTSQTASVATITTAGLATGVSPGTSNITASFNGVTSAAVALTVTAPRLQSIVVTPPSPSIAAGLTQQFIATGTFSDSSTQNLTSQVTWNSATTSVATIASTGLATGVSPGGSNITASLNGVTSSADVLTVTPQSVVITWATPAPITYGTPLSNAQLNATASVAGTFVYSPKAGTILAAGSQTLTATFTPSNTALYAVKTASVTLQVNQATPLVLWLPVPTFYGIPLGPLQLDALAIVEGSFVYTPAAGTTLDAGEQKLSAVFTPKDANFAVTTVHATLVVLKALPVITWAEPAAITTGTPLSATQLDATANVPGTFVYNPAAGTVLGGRRELETDGHFHSNRQRELRTRGSRCFPDGARIRVNSPPPEQLWRGNKAVAGT
jgi:Bacterial Ig-like domain (group 2)